MINIKESDNLLINLEFCNTRQENNRKMYCVWDLSSKVFKDYSYDKLCDMIQNIVAERLMNPINNIGKYNVWQYDTNSGQYLMTYMNGQPLLSLYIDIDALVILVDCTNIPDVIKREFSMGILKSYYTYPDREYTRIMNNRYQISDYKLRAESMKCLEVTTSNFKNVLSGIGKLSDKSINKVDNLINDKIFGVNVNSFVSDYYTFDANNIMEYANPYIISLKCTFLNIISTLVYNNKVRGMKEIVKEVNDMTPYVISGNPKDYIDERINNIDCLNAIEYNYTNPFGRI